MRFTPYLIMAVIIGASRLLQGRRHRRRSANEAARLAALLAVELRSLLEHYRDIFAMLAAGDRALMPLRGTGLVYRHNAGRIAGLLEEEIIVPVVACYAHHERIEAVLQACVKPNGGFSLRPEAEDVLIDRLRKRLMAGCELAGAAIIALTPPETPPRRPGLVALWADWARAAVRNWTPRPLAPARAWGFLGQPRPR